MANLAPAPRSINQGVPPVNNGVRILLDTLAPVTTLIEVGSIGSGVPSSIFFETDDPSSMTFFSFVDPEGPFTEWDGVPISLSGSTSLFFFSEDEVGNKESLKRRVYGFGGLYLYGENFETVSGSVVRLFSDETFFDLVEYSEIETLGSENLNFLPVREPAVLGDLFLDMKDSSSRESLPQKFQINQILVDGEVRRLSLPFNDGFEDITWD